jgi:hypothetical protein
LFVSVRAKSTDKSPSCEVCFLNHFLTRILAGVFGAYLLGVYDPDTETYQTISKLGTGFSEEQLQQLSDAMRPHVIQQPRPYYK